MVPPPPKGARSETSSSWHKRDSSLTLPHALLSSGDSFGLGPSESRAPVHLSFDATSHVVLDPRLPECPPETSLGPQVCVLPDRNVWFRIMLEDRSMAAAYVVCPIPCLAGQREAMSRGGPAGSGAGLSTDTGHAPRALPRDDMALTCPTPASQAWRSQSASEPGRGSGEAAARTGRSA